jgi:hypothetical protein
MEMATRKVAGSVVRILGLVLGVLLLCGDIHVLVTATADTTDGSRRTICFHVNSMVARGATRATLDYALHLRRLYGDAFRPVIVYPQMVNTTPMAGDPVTEPIQRPAQDGDLNAFYPAFAQHFTEGVDMFAYRHDPAESFIWLGLYNLSIGGRHMVELVEQLPCDLLYVLKHGSTESQPRYQNEGSSSGSDASLYPSKVPTVVHCVFGIEPHGPHTVIPLNPYLIHPTTHVVHKSHSDVYLPHMVTPPPPDVMYSSRPFVNRVLALKESLNIPRSSLVVCGFGGLDSFSVLPAIEAVFKLAFRFNRQQLNLVFMGLNPFKTILDYFSPSFRLFGDDAFRRKYGIHVLNHTYDQSEIETFMGACDVLLHARAIGETFGLAIAEFSVRNKPVLVHFDPTLAAHSAEHYRILASKGFYYVTSEDIVGQVSAWIAQGGVPVGDYNAYRDYTPEKVLASYS